LHAVRNARIHGRPARHHNIRVQILSDVDVTLHDRAVGGLVDAVDLKAKKRRHEQGLRTPEALVANGYDLAVRQLVALFQRARTERGRQLTLEVQRHVAQSLLDVAHNFALGSCDKRVASLGQDLRQEAGQVTASQVKSLNGVWQGVAFVINEE